MSKSNPLLSALLIVFGAAFCLLYPMLLIWPSGWSWHQGSPAASDYFMMIAGVYAVLGIFMIRAPRPCVIDLVRGLVEHRACGGHGLGGLSHADDDGPPRRRRPVPFRHRNRARPADEPRSVRAGQGGRLTVMSGAAHTAAPDMTSG